MSAPSPTSWSRRSAKPALPSHASRACRIATGCWWMAATSSSTSSARKCASSTTSKRCGRPNSPPTRNSLGPRPPSPRPTGPPSPRRGEEYAKVLPHHSSPRRGLLQNWFGVILLWSDGGLIDGDQADWAAGFCRCGVAGRGWAAGPDRGFGALVSVRKAVGGLARRGAGSGGVAAAGVVQGAAGELALLAERARVGGGLAGSVELSAVRRAGAGGSGTGPHGAQSLPQRTGAAGAVRSVVRRTGPATGAGGGNPQARRHAGCHGARGGECAAGPGGGGRGRPGG